MKLSEIKTLAEEGAITKALNEVNTLIERNETQYDEALRIRAYIYNLNENYPKSLEDRLAVLRSETPKLKDYFLAANAALYTKDYVKGKDLLRNLLEQGAARNNTWFDSAAYFLLAYCYAMLGDQEEANKNIDLAESLESDVSIPIPLVANAYNTRTLRHDIERLGLKRG